MDKETISSVGSILNKETISPVSNILHDQETIPSHNVYMYEKQLCFFLLAREAWNFAFNILQRQQFMGQENHFRSQLRYKTPGAFSFPGIRSRLAHMTLIHQRRCFIACIMHYCTDIWPRLKILSPRCASVRKIFLVNKYTPLPRGSGCEFKSGLPWLPHRPRIVYLRL